jgi:hypothetical protein
MHSCARFALFACLLGLLPVAGCGKDKGEKVPISGKVTLEGKPPKTKGYTLMFNREGSVNATTVPVSEDGSFSGEAFTGPNIVEIHLSGGHDPAGKGEAKGPPKRKPILYAALNVQVAKGESLTLEFKKAGPGGGH